MNMVFHMKYEVCWSCSSQTPCRNRMSMRMQIPKVAEKIHKLIFTLISCSWNRDEVKNLFDKWKESRKIDKLKTKYTSKFILQHTSGPASC